MAGQQVPMYPPATTVDDDTIFYMVEGGEQGVPDQGVSKSVTGAIVRKLFALQPDPWDVTGVSSPTIPTAFLEASAELVSGTDYLFSTETGVSQLKAAYGSPSPALVSGQQWSSYTRVAHDVGDTVEVYGFVITNKEATIADLLATFENFPVLVGSVNWLLYSVCDHASGASFSIFATPSSNTGAFPFASLNPGDKVFLGVDYDTGEFVREIGLTTTAFNPGLVIDGVRQFFIASCSDNVGTLLAGTIPVSFSDTTGGKTGFSSLGDAVPPEFALDGKKYLVQNSGTFNGKTLNDGDVAEFYNAVSEVIVTQKTPLTVQDVESVVNAALVSEIPQILAGTLADGILAFGRIEQVVNDLTLAGANGVWIVGLTPTGNLAGLTPGSLVVRSNDTLTPIPNSDDEKFFGVPFTFFTTFGSPFKIRKVDNAGLPSGNDQPYYSPQGSQSYGAATEQELRGLGWVLEAPTGLGYMKKRIHDFSGFGSASIEQGTADYFDVIINQDFTLFAGITVQPATSGIIRVTNNDAAPHNLYLGAGTYSIPAFSSKMFICIGDSFTSTQFTAPLTP